MSSEDSRAVVKRFRDALNACDVEGAAAVLAPNVAVHMQNAPEPLTRESFKQLGQLILGAFPGGVATVEDMIVAGDTVVSRLTFRGTHTGNLMGIPPTGKSVAIAETIIDRIADGKIIESWRMFDQMAMMQQLGLLPAPGTTPAVPATGYLDYTGRTDLLAGGVQMIKVQTPKGEFRVWTKRVGNNPRIKVLLLHGGPGATHEYFEAFDSYFPAAGIEYYYYDQLGSAYSDQPNEPELWDLPRFVDEVEQVRQALDLDRENFYLLGHSWGGILAIEYALKYQQQLKGLIISNMMASIPAYNHYARTVLMPAMDQTVLDEVQRLEATGKTEEPRYMELLMPHHYEQHLLRMPAGEWPDPVNRAFQHLNRAVYVPTQGPSELGASGKLVNWERTADLGRISVPTLVIGARYDTMDPAHMEMMAASVQKGRYLFCPKGSHLAMYDDQTVYVDGVIQFTRDVDAGRF